jgi:hypothetical protein
MDSVDTGWITEENPLKLRLAAGGFCPPLDIVDGAACSGVSRRARRPRGRRVLQGLRAGAMVSEPLPWPPYIWPALSGATVGIGTDIRPRAVRCVSGISGARGSSSKQRRADAKGAIWSAPW